jgi:hypothetical protein
MIHQSDITQNLLSGLTYQEVSEKLESLGNNISVRESEYIKDAGLNTNSIIDGFLNGSISVITSEESKLMHDLKQELMSRTSSEMKAARERNLARRAVRKIARELCSTISH